jgi:integrase
MASIVKRINQDGKGVYFVRIRRKGSPTQIATFPRLADAKKWAQITETAILEGRHFPTTEAKRHTVHDLLERYRNDVLPHKRSSTIYNQVYHLRWWEAQLGHYALSAITPALIVEYRDKLARTRENSTVRRYLAVFSHAFTVAVQEWQWCDENPFHKVSKPKEPRGRVRFLTDDERQRLLDSCQVSRNSSLYTIVVLALSTGARRGELLSLHWLDVDLKRGMLTFRKTKNGETRAVPLTGYALEVLTQHAKIRRLDTALVFPERTGTRPMSIREAWKFAVKRAGITNFRFHDLRHSAASYLAMGGASLAEIAEVLGHKTLQMTKRYTHLTESHTRGVVERMNQTIFGK